MRRRISVIGRGRMGSTLARALGTAEPLGRGSDGAGADIVLLCVPDAEIAAAAACVPEGPLVGHCSGASTLEALTPHEAFSLHPLTTVTAGTPPADLAGVPCAVAGSTPRALGTAIELARTIGMEPLEIADEDRAAYHAAASIASNFLVTLEDAAERMLRTAGAGRELLVPLVRAAIENWAAHGPERALTGPIARGDDATVARQREAVERRAPELLELYDALAAATRALASRASGSGLPGTTAPPATAGEPVAAAPRSAVAA